MFCCRDSSEHGLLLMMLKMKNCQQILIDLDYYDDKNVIVTG